MNDIFDFESQRDQLALLCQRLREFNDAAPALSNVESAVQRMQLCRQHNVFKWFTSSEHGGFGWSTDEIMHGYLEISAACLSTAFILTQRHGAVSRITGSENKAIKHKLLKELANGETFCSVGISHLTTSHRHLEKPILTAKKCDGGYKLDGFSPWVTGISLADSIVIGATVVEESEKDRFRPNATDDEILILVETNRTGVTRPETPHLVALSDSCTGEVRFDNVLVGDENLLGGPIPKIMFQGKGGNTGGLQTSTLALGLSDAAITFLEEQSSHRNEFENPATSLRTQYNIAKTKIFALANGIETCTSQEIRATVNSLVLRSTQAAMMAAKGAGYRADHRIGRWCKEALFFLVWSCPQPVAETNLCELAQIS